MRIAVLVAGAMTLASCAWAGEDDRMYEMAARAAQVARAVHYTARSPAIAPELDGEALVARASVNDPATLAALADFHVTARRQGKASVVLVCDKARTQALLEDAGCTQPVERHRWQESPRGACAFTVDPASVCH